MKLYTSKVMADWLGVTERRIRQLRDEGVLSERAPGLYDHKATVKAYILYLRKGNAKDLNDEKALLTRAKREAAEMENGLRRESLHTTEDVEKGGRTIYLNLRSKLLSLPAKLSGELAQLNGNQAEIFDRLKLAVYEALEELSDGRTALLERDEADDGDESAG